MTLDFLGDLQRTHMCGDLRADDASKDVVVMGWVNRRRDHGNLIFLDVRDRSGLTQVVLDKEIAAAAHAKGETARPEYVVAARGTVRRRDAGLENPNMATGEIEVVASELLLLNDAKTPPFSPAEDAIANEEVRLKYRYLDLRRTEMQKNFKLRHDVARAVRNYLSDEGFLEIETPFMTRSTPEGARDYLVPSRVHAGEFYALPQSPQIFKQILMVSGFDKYFQIARCFRDEDLRADRQPEFTQIDLEMTFPQQELIFKTVEGFLTAAFKTAGIGLTTPFVHMTYDEAIRNYGIDKPDMRLPAMVDVTSAFTAEDLFELKIGLDKPVVAIVIPRENDESDQHRPSKTLSKKISDEIVQTIGTKPVAQMNMVRLAGSKYSALYSRIDSLCGLEMERFTGRKMPHGRCEPENLMFVFNALPDAPVRWANDVQWYEKLLGIIRLDLGRKLEHFHQQFYAVWDASVAGETYFTEALPISPELVRRAYKFCWVTDFPMYEWDEEAKVWQAAHHPFTSPHEEDIKAGRLTDDKGAVRALAYDIVLNGTELGSGSIRIHRKDVQAEIFRSLGMDEAEQKARFGFFLDALEYGTPPHGGIALGLDRIVMILAGASSLREVIAFPKTAKAIDLMVDAPTPVSEQQLRELSLRTVTRS